MSVPATPAPPVWRDDAIRHRSEDTLDRDQLARRVANLITKTHSWESSLVFGITGPWGSGKSSLIGLVRECLEERDSAWSIAEFTPWAASDTESLLGEFYAAIAAALPQRKGKAARKALAACARVATPALKLVPGVGGALSDGAALAERSLARRPPWNRAFDQCARELRKLGRPVLVVADDIDRLQPDELLVFLKVIRLLGRFPGVSYLLAYDERTIFSRLDKDGYGDVDSGAGRRYMEKIVQYPIAVPPLLPSQMLERLDSRLTGALSRLGRSLPEGDARLARLSDEFERQFTTPRAVDRFLAQVELVMSMHDPNEINDIDLILLTFLRVQFPDLYSELIRWRRQLIAKPSTWQLMRRDADEVDWEPLLATVKDPEARRDAREVLGVVFPATVRGGSWASRDRGASHPDYFDRYFVNSIPAHDIADSVIADALTEAAVRGPENGLLRGLLRSSAPGRVDLAITKLWNRSLPERNDGLASDFVTIPLLAAVASEIDHLPGGTNSIFRRSERAVRWAAELIQALPPETDPAAVLGALSECETLGSRLHVLWSAASVSPDDDVRGSNVARGPVAEAARLAANDALDGALAHLQRRDQASTEDSCLFLFRFIARFGSLERARDSVLADLGVAYSAEDLAARFVALSYLVGPRPVPGIESFDQATFERFAPDDDPLYDESSPREVDTRDVSWPNRRAFVHGRARRPTAPGP